LPGARFPRVFAASDAPLVLCRWEVAISDKPVRQDAAYAPDPELSHTPGDSGRLHPLYRTAKALQWDTPQRGKDCVKK
jgi:hypothetical protein